MLETPAAHDQPPPLKSHQPACRGWLTLDLGKVNKCLYRVGFSFAITNTRSGTHDVALLLNLCHLSVVLATSQSQFIQYFALGWFAATHTPFNEMWGISLLQLSCLYCLWILCLSDQCVITDSPTPVALYGNDLRVDLAFLLLMPQRQPHTPWSYYSLL